MRPDNSWLNLYYAHLDSQIVQEGQQVKTGDVLGLTGNTGNARFTASHLHFGIYTNNGPIDPLYFVKPSNKEPAKLSVSLNNLNIWMRSGKKARLYADQSPGTTNFFPLQENTLLIPEAGAGSYYRVVLPDGKKGFVPGTMISSIVKPLKRLTIKKLQPLYSTPDTAGLQKKLLLAGEKINVLAAFNDFYFVSEKDNIDGWILQP